MKIIPSLIFMFIGYLLGVVFTDYMFADASMTNWSNIWVYAWMLLWPFMLFFKFILWGIAIFVVIAAIVYLWDRFTYRRRW